MQYTSEILGDGMAARFGKGIGYTHTGYFTADNILCGALCKVMNSNFQIYRRDQLPDDPTAEDKIFWDFDTTEESFNLYNWKVNAEYRSDMVRYGSFGLMWRDWGAYIILPWDKPYESRHKVEFMVDQFDIDIIEPMDLVVMGPENHPSHPWINMLEMFNFLPNEKDLIYSHQDPVLFFKAVDMATEFLGRLCEKYKMACDALVKIYESYDPYDDMAGIIYLDDELQIDTDWALEFVRERMDGIDFMIRTSEVCGYNIYPVKKTVEELQEQYPTKWDDPEKLGPLMYKTPFPKTWYGQRPEDLNKIYEGLCFCQYNASMASCKTYDTAVLICKNLRAKYTNIDENEEVENP